MSRALAVALILFGFTSVAASQDIDEDIIEAMVLLAEQLEAHEKAIMQLTIAVMRLEAQVDLNRDISLIILGALHSPAAVMKAVDEVAETEAYKSIRETYDRRLKESEELIE